MLLRRPRTLENSRFPKHQWGVDRRGVMGGMGGMRDECPFSKDSCFPVYPVSLSPSPPSLRRAPAPANMLPDVLREQLEGMQRGVYFGWARLPHLEGNRTTGEGEAVKEEEGEGEAGKGGPRVLKMVLNVGRRPTFVDGDDVTVVRDDVTVGRDDVTVGRDDVTVVRHDVNVVRDGVTVVRDDVTVVRVDVTVKRDEVTVESADVMMHLPLPTTLENSQKQLRFSLSLVKKGPILCYTKFAFLFPVLPLPLAVPSLPFPSPTSRSHSLFPLHLAHSTS
ncbi:unnamed protein product [Closterium sp. NIES-53]